MFDSTIKHGCISHCSLLSHHPRRLRLLLLELRLLMLRLHLRKAPRVAGGSRRRVRKSGGRGHHPSAGEGERRVSLPCDSHLRKNTSISDSLSQVRA